MNSPTNLAQPGSVVSVFVNGLAPDPQVNYAPLQLTAANGWQVTNIVQVSLSWYGSTFSFLHR